MINLIVKGIIIYVIIDILKSSKKQTGNDEKSFGSMNNTITKFKNQFITNKVNSVSNGSSRTFAG